MTTPRYTVPGMKPDSARDVIGVLQARLVALIDLGLTLKHIHWNVVGPSSSACTRCSTRSTPGCALMVDAVAERIATLGGSPTACPGALVAGPLVGRLLDRPGRRQAHLAALDLVYSGVIADHRAAIETVEELDPVTRRPADHPDRRARGVPLVRAGHLENADGTLRSADASTEEDAARSATR